MAIDSKNSLVWVKAMSRGQALPLDASEVYGSIAEAENYAATSAIAYPGQNIKALGDDGKYHIFTLQPSETGYALEEVSVTGPQGPAGPDGYSPSAKVESIDSGVRISITDKGGTTTADIPFGSGGGTSAQSDWNAAEGEPGHVLNRPFYSYTETTINKSKLASGTYTSEYMVEFGVYGAVVGLDAGTWINGARHFDVIFDGVEYRNLEMFYNDLAGSLVGNGALLTPLFEAYGMQAPEDTGEPFVIRISSDDPPADAILISDLTQSTTHEFVLTQVEEKTEDKHVKLPEVYYDRGVGAVYGAYHGEVFNDYEHNGAPGEYSHAEGYETVASATCSHAEGFNTLAAARYTHAEGNGTVASGTCQHVQGRFNLVHDMEKYAHIVGNGDSGSDRSNAHTLDWDGVPWFAGDRVMLGGTGMDDENAVALKPIFAPQELTDEQKAQSRANIGATTVDEVLGQIPQSGGKAIIDVVELPTENIDEDVFYRLLTGSLVINRAVQNAYTCHCVESLPETGLPATNLDQTAGHIYYTVGDGELYGYVDDMLSMAMGVPAGWYPGAILLEALGFGYSGVITNIMDDPIDNTFRLLISYVVYSYKDSWTSHKSIGLPGTGPSSEIFNDPMNIASGHSSHAEGSETIASGDRSHAEGSGTTASGDYSHAEGSNTTASGHTSHAEGNFSHAEGSYSHAEGSYSHAEGNYSHAEGNFSHAEGFSSHAEGNYSRAVGRSQHVQGEYNRMSPVYSSDTTYARAKYAHIVGNGIDENNRSNAHTLDWEGNAWFQGDIFVGGTGQDDENAKKVATEEYVNSKIPSDPGSSTPVDFKTDETLTLKDGVLSVNTTNTMEQDNTLPITSAGVFATVGNIEALLKTI